MALSKLEKTQVLRHFKIPPLAIEPNTVYYSLWIDQKLTSVDEMISIPNSETKSPGTLTAEMESELKTLLGRVNNIDEILSKAVTRFKVSSVGGDIQLDPEEESRLRSEKRKIIKEMKIILYIDDASEAGFSG